jgi:hypothetical protein
VDDYSRLKEGRKLMADAPAVVAPEVGMPVTWIHPSEDRANARFIEESLIGRWGTQGLKINAVVDRCEFTEEWRECGKERWEVVLERDGAVLIDTWPREWGPEPTQFKPTPLSCSWHYLKPL